MPLWDQISELVFPLAGVAVGAVTGIVLRGIVVPRVRRRAAQTRTRIDDLLLGAVRGPLVLWTSALGLYAGLSLSPLEPRIADTTKQVILAIVIVSASWTTGRIAAGLVRLPQSTASALPSARILSTAVHAVVVAVGLLVALQTLGISVAPILTALGVGGLAVGLALQDTLANLFAGLHLLVTRQVRPGDFVQLATGEQGFVEDISWRNTTIRQLPNNIVIVPNAQLAQAITTNYSLPDSEQATLVEVGVSYDDDLEFVERVTVEVARSVQRDVSGGVPEFDPFVRFHSFAESSINFTVIMRANAFTDNYLMKHEFVKRLHARYRAEGITIPFPQRTVHVRQDHPAARPA